MSQPLAYWHCGGDVFAGRTAALTNADVKALQALYRDEAVAAARAGDEAAQRMALRLMAELFAATLQARRWRRAAVFIHATQRAHSNSSES